MWTINDFPVYGNLSRCTVKGYYACSYCGEDTYSVRLNHSKKNAYTGHCRLLPTDRPFQRQKKAFNGKQEFGSPVIPLNREKVLKRVNRICTR